MQLIADDTSRDSTLALARDGYAFISKRCRRYGSEVSQTRLMLRRTICMGVEAAAQVSLNDDTRFVRQGAAPARLQKALFGQGSLQGFDGDAQLRRMQMFMSLVTRRGIGRLADLAAEQWRASAARWEEEAGEVVHFDEAREILCRAVCARAGVPLAEPEVTRRTDDFAAIIDGSRAVGLRHWRRRRARRRAEKWAGDLVERVRSETPEGTESDALRVIARHRDLGGGLLERRVAAVEFIDVLRPTVAVQQLRALRARGVLRPYVRRGLVALAQYLLSALVGRLLSRYVVLDYLGEPERETRPLERAARRA